MKIAVAGTGYVGLSVALLLSQHNEVHALDIIPAKIELLNNGKHSSMRTGPASGRWTSRRRSTRNRRIRERITQ